MNDPEHRSGRIEAKGRGIGEVSDAMIRDRARDLAVQEGRADQTLTSDLIARATRELTGETPPIDADDSTDLIAEEIPPDEVRSSHGYMTEKTGPAAESNVVRDLVEEGVAEAAHEQMTQAERAARQREQI